ncbi:hypothetical protein Val02_29970 [Virgisporangium aliadipatigenens]|uniref:Uncharacterized protein n=1 Tax=Virgisporangium aliadipatigenens TaxID=741659 RepID=A0A8J3YJ78_9ACTN|nr:hypothetical protein Val02_29970 [Virgisporangium aliadipatigenens]
MRAYLAEQLELHGHRPLPREPNLSTRVNRALSSNLQCRYIAGATASVQTPTIGITDGEGHPMCWVQSTACVSCNAGHHLRYVVTLCCPDGCGAVNYSCGSC